VIIHACFQGWADTVPKMNRMNEALTGGTGFGPAIEEYEAGNAHSDMGHESVHLGDGESRPLGRRKKPDMRFVGGAAG
jgi:hypothetical protein